MSFDVAVWRTNKGLSNKEALATYQRITENDVSSVVADDSLLEFFKDLDAIFPLGGDLPEDELDQLPWSWSCTPSRTHYVLGVQGKNADEALKVIQSLVRKHGLTLFDPQSGTIAWSTFRNSKEWLLGLLALIIALVLAIAIFNLLARAA